MILGALIDMFGRVIYFIIGLLPTATTYPSQIESALTWVFNQAYGWNWLLPIDTIITILGISAAFYTGLFAVNGVKWILNMMRGAGA